MAPTTPSTASPLSTSLHATALEFLHSCDCDPSQPTRLNHARIHAIRAPGYTHTFGPSYFVSVTPPLQGTLSTDGFIAHMERMLPMLESWDTTVTDVCVDEARRSVVVRARYGMRVKGAEVEVQNDIVWWLWMAEDEGVVKVERSVEFVDGVASGRLKEVMGEMKAKAKEEA
ncbi:hypothetical protein BU26DRAFT_524507 [Trematosphaeria pertusa]|uniref:SnoaL-like domain-containing protein n=1 Tax=Trematosphaeria pertusa TaxID=390896 RepID=A0A6A6HWB3_9PLEO|nr:uncharacterized protein BU26DRAFT_524507 [Trematosphaeria pertusa]KAF2242376.1 hypothetical protein BU26DRAFT_524507 [Trematosphaeria pertusa]